MVSFWTKGSTVQAQAGVAGRASATLTALSAKGEGAWAVSATVSGSSCEQRVAKVMFRVAGKPARQVVKARAVATSETAARR